MPAAGTRRSTPGAPTEGGPALDLSIALHFGDVIYGNIGTARRLDFTVIGPAVNEVSRMEALSKELGREVLLSQSIAQRCGHPVLSLGLHELRGTAGRREMFALAPPSVRRSPAGTECAFSFSPGAGCRGRGTP